MKANQRILSTIRFVREPFRDVNRLDRTSLFEHVLATYFNIRVCTGIVALLFPLVLWLGGYVFGDERITVRGSISAYYHTDMRSIFVGGLLFVGTILVLYRGYTDLENYTLNLAGLLAYGIATFPTSAPDGVEVFTAPKAHFACAISFFLCIAYVCIWRSRDTLDNVEDEDKRNQYKWTYRILGWLMVLLPVLAAILLKVKGQHYVVFGVEVAAVWVFGTYWIVKSFEVKESSNPDPSQSEGLENIPLA